MHRLTSSLSAYACHMTRTWSRDTHSTEVFLEEDDLLLPYSHFNWQEKTQQTRVLT